jgi:chemosensory pili system protein ChpA (sensor histidine kinase/response regulator)
MDSSLRDSELPADLSPLAWVQEELRRSLESVHKTLRRLVRDGNDNRLSAFGGDTQPSVPLQQAAAQLHQVSGVLSLVGLPAGAAVLRAAEAAVARLSERPLEVEASTVDVIERADFALLAYVARLLAGNRTSSLALYPGYRALQQLHGAERIHPADLWQYDWAWRSIPLEAGVLPRSPEAVRAPFEAALLRQMREPTSAHAANLSGLFAGRHGAHAVAARRRRLRGPGPQAAGQRRLHQAPGLQAAARTARAGPGGTLRARRAGPAVLLRPVPHHARRRPAAAGCARGLSPDG